MVATGAGLVVAIVAALGYHALMNSLDGFAAQVASYLKNRSEEGTGETSSAATGVAAAEANVVGA